MKNKDANNNPLLIFFFAVLFIGGGVAGALVVILRHDPLPKMIMVVLLGTLLAAVGTVFLGFAIYRKFMLTIAKKLETDPTAQHTTGKFLGAKVTGYSSTTYGGVRGEKTYVETYYTILYEYYDERGVRRRVRSIKSFFPNQTEHLRKLGEFAIVCRGKISVIVEKLPKGQF